MADRPILFSAPMVRALLAGTKTQTRRPVKITHRTPGLAACLDPLVGATRPRVAAELCPYGQPGDRLWVRESWAPDPPDIDGWGYATWAGCREGRIAGVPERFRNPRHCVYAASWPHAPMRWTPSIHMPRWASRITLEITDVRVQRLQDISREDAMAEGIVIQPDGGYGLADTSHYHATDPRHSYWSLWEAINGPGSVEANPWVWVVTFAPAGPNT